MIKGRAVPVPSDSLLAPLFAGGTCWMRSDFTYRRGGSDDLEVLARILFERAGGWIRALTWRARCRDGDGWRQVVSRRSVRARGGAGCGDRLTFPLLSKSAGRVVGRTTGISTPSSGFLLRTGARAAGARWCQGALP